MEEERKMILQMLQDGKISAEEAVSLMKALASTASAASTASGASAGQASRGAPPLSGESPEAPGAPEPPEPPEPDNGSRSILGRFMRGFPFAFAGNFDRYRFEETHEGKFFPADGPVRLDFRTFNGRITLRAWDRDDYRVEIHKSVHGTSEDEARERAAKLVEMMADAGSLTIKASSNAESGLGWGWNWGNGGVTIEANIPRSLRYEVHMSTANGRIELEGFKGTTVEARTANGRVSVADITAEHIRLNTSNGRISARASAANIEAETSNGSVSVVPVGMASGPAEQSYDLRTSNGSIRVRTDGVANDQVGLVIDARTSMGSIDADVPRLVYDERDRSLGRRVLRAHSEGYESKPIRVKVSARTSNGSIRFSPTVDVD